MVDSAAEAAVASPARDSWRHWIYGIARSVPNRPWPSSLGLGTEADVRAALAKGGKGILKIAAKFGVGKLNPLKIAKDYGDLPQNVNFEISTTTLS